ncbi:MAG: hypothetical protein HC898_04680 [Phycisphaerales bacterium]|nr:hypothetical protein [Phycisphaerales bacterium]
MTQTNTPADQPATPTQPDASCATEPTAEQGKGCCCGKGGQGCAPGRCRCCKVAMVGLVVLLLLVVGAELFARFYLGLGDPPLLMADEKIEYLYQPNQDGYRFGNHYRYNAYSMRSDDFPQTKSDPNELRVMVLGDSVINGGGHIDQADVPTTVMQQLLAEKLKRPVVVGNISTGSWGPANMLAYVEKYGYFEADVVVLVLSSHDAEDAPTFQPMVGVLRDYPDRKPWLAVGELFSRYGGVVRWWITDKLPENTEVVAAPTEEDRQQTLKALGELIEKSKASGARVMVAQFFEVKELLGTPNQGYMDILGVSRSHQVPVVKLFENFRRAIDEGKVVYRDQWIHPSAAGSRIIGETLAEEVARRVLE